MLFRTAVGSKCLSLALLASVALGQMPWTWQNSLKLWGCCKANITKNLSKNCFLILIDSGNFPAPKAGAVDGPGIRDSRVWLCGVSGR